MLAPVTLFFPKNHKSHVVFEINEDALSSRNYSGNKFSESPNGSPTHDLPEYRLDALTTELWRTQGE